MSESYKKIVWIGEAQLKRVNRMGRDFYFPRGEAVSIPEHIAYELLQLPSCFAKPEQAEELIKSSQEHNAKLQALAEQAAKEKAKADAANSWSVMIDGEIKDISKFTKAKLETVIVAESLPIDVNNVPEIEGETPAQCLRIAVRNALHEKSGNPDLESN